MRGKIHNNALQNACFSSVVDEFVVAGTGGLVFAIYPKFNEKDLRKLAMEAISMAEEWFTKNKKRQTCRIELWYGKVVSVKRNTVTQQINKLLDETIAQEMSAE